VLVISGSFSGPTLKKRGLSLALVCMSRLRRESLKKQQGTHLCKQVQQKPLTRHFGGGTASAYRNKGVKEVELFMSLNIFGNKQCVSQTVRVL
jgi:hypothetical protein